MRIKADYSGTQTRKCAICGEEITTTVPLGQWQYKHIFAGKQQYFCCYKCWKKALENVKHYRNLSA